MNTKGTSLNIYTDITSLNDFDLKIRNIFHKLDACTWYIYQDQVTSSYISRSSRLDFREWRSIKRLKESSEPQSTYYRNNSVNIDDIVLESARETPFVPKVLAGKIVTFFDPIDNTSLPRAADQSNSGILDDYYGQRVAAGNQLLAPICSHIVQLLVTAELLPYSLRRYARESIFT